MKIELPQWRYTPRQLRTARRKYALARAVFFDKAGTSSERVESDLTTADYAALVARWIDRALADRARLRRVDSQTDGEIVGRNNGNYAGILIPYFHPGSDHVREYWLRRDQPDFEFDSTENLKPRQKYLSPPGRSNVIIECEFKTLALWRLANYGSPNRPRFLPLGQRRLQLARNHRQNSRARRSPP